MRILFTPPTRPILNGKLSAHADTMINRLELGETIFDAITLANVAMPPRGMPLIDEDQGILHFELLKMILYGDSGSSLNRIYRHNVINEAEEMGDPIAETYSTWYMTW